MSLGLYGKRGNDLQDFRQALLQPRCRAFLLTASLLLAQAPVKAASRKRLCDEEKSQEVDGIDLIPDSELEDRKQPFPVSFFVKLASHTMTQIGFCQTLV